MRHKHVIRNAEGLDDVVEIEWSTPVPTGASAKDIAQSIPEDFFQPLDGPRAPGIEKIERPRVKKPA